MNTLLADAAVTTAATTSSWTPGVWVSLAACIVAIAASIPAYIALRFTRAAADSAVAQTRLQQEIATQARMPRVWVDVHPHDAVKESLYLFVGNSGASVAHAVRVYISPRIAPGDLFAEATPKVQDAAERGIATLMPGRVYEWRLGMAREVIEANLAVPEHTITIKYETSDGVEIVDTYPIRMSDLWTTAIVGGGSLREVAQSVNALKGEVSKMTLEMRYERLRSQDED